MSYFERPQRFEELLPLPSRDALKAGSEGNLAYTRLAPEFILDGFRQKRDEAKINGDDRAAIEWNTRVMMMKDPSFRSKYERFYSTLMGWGKCDPVSTSLVLEYKELVVNSIGCYCPPTDGIYHQELAYEVLLKNLLGGK